MHAGQEDLMAVRQEMLDLLRQQMEVLDSPLGLSDSKLMECYARQTRVQELREKLQAASNPPMKIASASSAAQALSNSADSAAPEQVTF